MPAEHVDVLVIGGGMVGAAFAAALADSGLGLTVLDAQAPRAPGDAEPARVEDIEVRVSALTLASQALIANLGAWQHLAPHACAYTRMDVWDADGTGSLVFDAADTGTTQLGWIAGNVAIAHALHLACAAHGNIRWLAPVRVAEIARAGDRWQVTLADGRSFVARLLVGADGAQSQVRERLGIPVRLRDYRHRAVVATVATEESHDGCARQRFIETGPLAFLPMQGGDGAARGHCHSIVWSCVPAEAERVLALDDESFARELSRALEGRLGRVTGVSRRASFPLIERHAQAYVRDNAVLLGDAAHTVHPLAGQGVNLGFLDAATLAEEIAGNLAAGLPFDEPLALRRFERRRKWHNLAMQQSFAGMKWLFGARELPLRWVRNTGMSLVDRVAPLKVLAARQAMGLDGDLPARCRQPVRGADLL